MLEMFGDSAPVAPKRKVAAAIAAGEGPSALHVGNDRFARASVRVAPAVGSRPVGAKARRLEAMYDKASCTEAD